MFSKQITYKDAILKINPITSKVDVLCRGYRASLSQDEFMAQFLYPALDAAAKKQEPSKA